MQFRVYYRDGQCLYVFTVEADSVREAKRLAEYMAGYECPNGQFHKVEKFTV